MFREFIDLVCQNVDFTEVLITNIIKIHVCYLHTYLSVKLILVVRLEMKI